MAITAGLKIPPDRCRGLVCHEARGNDTGTDACAHGYQARGNALAAAEMIGIFQALVAQGRLVPLGEATAGVASWLTNNCQHPSDDDCATLTTFGAVLYDLGLREWSAAQAKR